ncbi:hypothetical protein I5M27_14190 [Adhaeribacter sp. BT258]|uniref:Lipocalin-like domain-containing protein n=1 Tax=Adhaeribacter terrigena TaxID=2793070 RepID=A0ABS1C412_9BACT|nr:hypothetical protein [Adhaeribacter terrigena]MBK0404141.1 hypothetical protein [Adhaeribacter terrigena]
MPFRFIPGALLLCLMLLAGTCKKKTPKETLKITNALLGKTWLHSHEEDRGDTLVYRPNSYDFPPSRGRIGFQLEADGNLKQYDIAPTDGLEEKAGKWQIRDKNRLEVTFPKRNSMDYDAEIISIDADKLILKRTFK